MVRIIVLRIFVFKPIIPTMSTKDQITEILLATGRSGMEQVIAFMESSGYFVKPGGGHHKEEGGLAQHCLEVYRIMKSTSLSLPADGIVVSAFFHDLGKVNRRFGRVAMQNVPFSCWTIWVSSSRRMNASPSATTTITGISALSVRPFAAPFPSPIP